MFGFNSFFSEEKQEPQAETNDERTMSEMMTPEQVRERHDIPPARFKRLQNEAIREMRTCLQNKGMTFSDFTEGS